MTCDNCGVKLSTLDGIGGIGQRAQRPVYAQQTAMRGYALCHQCAIDEEEATPPKSPSTGGGRRVMKKGKSDA